MINEDEEIPIFMFEISLVSSTILDTIFSSPNLYRPPKLYLPEIDILSVK